MIIFTKAANLVQIFSLFLFIGILGGCQQQPQPSHSTKVESIYLTDFTYPDTIYFAGHRLPLEDPEIRIRFEREFHNILHNDNTNLLLIKEANRMMPIINPIIKEFELPEDLIYVPFAESGFRNQVSSAGAAGVWQIMPAIGEYFGLQMNYWVDERNHVEKATVAAMKLYKDMYRKFKDWNLVTASYNVGETLIRNQMRFQHVNDFFSLYLNEQTSRYVFRMYAFKVIFEDPTRYGLPAYEFVDTDIETLTVNGPIDNLSDFALKQGITYRELRLANPWIRRQSLPNGKWTLKLHREGYRSVLKGDYLEKATEFYKNENSRTISHIIGPNENLLTLSNLYDVEILELMKWNQLKSQQVEVGNVITVNLW